VKTDTNKCYNYKVARVNSGPKHYLNKIR